MLTGLFDAAEIHVTFVDDGHPGRARPSGATSGAPTICTPALVPSRVRHCERGMADTY